VSRPPKFRSLAAKLSLFTVLLVSWVAVTLISCHLARPSFSAFTSLAVGVAVMALAVGVAQITSRLLVRPLEVLHDAMASVGSGRLETIEISRTRDEIELLGESFNHMIAALSASREEVRSYQENLEERIRQRTEELEAAMVKAQEANRAKSEFLANMSHELRTPMNGLLGMLDMVLDGYLTTAQREELETARSCANTLLVLLNDILDLSKIEAGKLTIEQVPFELRPLVAETLKPLQLKARQKGLELLAEISSAVPQRIIGDPLRMRQILFNLLGNAIKFTERGSVKLRLNGRPAEAGRIELQIDVTDTGPGIPQDKQGLIFENFTQADGSITRKFGGTGLGLAITRRLTEMQGGRIWVESEAGRGAAFHVVLEAGQPEDLPVQQQLSPNILLVEDNVINQKVVTVTLRKKGYEVVVANNGREALDALARSQFDLVLMDLQMPVLDGLEATRQIRLNPRFDSLPVVALTAHTAVAERERAREAGVDGYLTKPVLPAELLAAVEKHLSGDRRPACPVPAKLLALSS
jgi:signal transduction histidine kinase/ActR/RegA family two-component response regulator